MLKKHRIGIMGGTFDPIHIGHLMLAQAAYETLQLEKVVFIPAGNPPHKRDKIIGTSGMQRAEMVRLAISSDDRFALDLREIRKESYSYTWETLQELHRTHPENEYYFIIGGDSLRDFHTWKNPERIVDFAHIAASFRPGLEEGMEELLSVNRKQYGGHFDPVPAPMLDISSHEIREKIAQGKAFRYYIPEKVYHYIIENGLYIEESTSR